MNIFDVIIKLNNFLKDRRLRTFFSLLSIGHGTIRLIEGTSFTSASFGNDIVYGILLITLGFLLFITSAKCLRNGILSHLVVAALAGVYATLGVAIISSNTSSAFTVFMIVAYLLIEEIFIYER